MRILLTDHFHMKILLTGLFQMRNGRIWDRHMMMLLKGTFCDHSPFTKFLEVKFFCHVSSTKGSAVSSRVYRVLGHTGGNATETVRTCPICRVLSYYVVPSKFWVADEQQKARVLAAFRHKTSAIHCRHFARAYPRDHCRYFFREKC